MPIEARTFSEKLSRFLAAFASRQPSVAGDGNGDLGGRFAELVRDGGGAGDGAGPARQAAACVPTRLRITAGLHRGASLALDAAEYRVASDEDADIVLSDLGRGEWRLVRSATGYVCVESTPDGPRTLVPIDVASGADAVEATFSIGEVGFTLTCPRKTTSRTRALRRARPHASRWRDVWRGRRWVAPAMLASAVMTVAMAAAHWHGAQPRPDIAERVVRGTQALTREGFRNVRFVPNDDGRLGIAGVVSGAAEHQRLREWLADSPYADALSLVRESDQVIEQLRQVLTGESLKITSAGSRVRIDGETTRASVKNDIRALADELDGVVDLDDRVTYLNPRKDPGPGPLRVRVRSVMIGTPSYFRTDTGALYFEGAVMPDGAEVMAIEEKQIRFRLADKIVVYPLG